MSFLLLHGAFRGGWAWGEVPDRLRAAGHRVEAPTLAGMAELAPPQPGRTAVSLQVWVDQIAALAHLSDLSGIVLVGHSQGGMVARAAAEALGPRLAGLMYLDSPLPQQGQRGVDLMGPRDEETLPPADMWLDPQPLPVEHGYTQELCDFINPRLGPTPVGPSLDPIDGPEPTVATRVAFCTMTPRSFPSTLARDAHDAAGASYELFDSPHDVALAEPQKVAEWLLGSATEPDS